MTTLQQMAEGQANAHVVFNENAAAVSAVALFAKNPVTSVGLTWGYYGGRYVGNDVSNGTIALTDDADNWVVVERSTGILSASTSDTNATDVLYAAIYQATTVAGVVTTVVDLRMDTNGLLINAFTDNDLADIITAARTVPRRTSGLASGETLSTTSNVTVDTRAAGTACSVLNASDSPITLTQDAGMTQYLAGVGTTGSLTLAGRGMAYLWWDTTTDVYTSGPGVS